MVIYISSYGCQLRYYLNIYLKKNFFLNKYVRIDRGSLRGALHFCTSFLNYDSCYSTLYIFWKVIFFSF